MARERESRRRRRRRERGDVQGEYLCVKMIYSGYLHHCHYNKHVRPSLNLMNM